MTRLCRSRHRCCFRNRCRRCHRCHRSNLPAVACRLRRLRPLPGNRRRPRSSPCPRLRRRLLRRQVAARRACSFLALFRHRGLAAKQPKTLPLSQLNSSSSSNRLTHQLPRQQLPWYSNYSLFCVYRRFVYAMVIRSIHFINHLDLALVSCLRCGHSIYSFHQSSSLRFSFLLH